MCPTIPAAFYQPYPVWHDTLAPKAVELLQEHPAITVSGRCIEFWGHNSQIGKTTAVKNRLIPMLRRSDIRVSYLNIQKLISQHTMSGTRHFDYDRLLRKAHSMPRADVLILDEIHHTFPVERARKRYEHFGKPYIRALIDFWTAVDGHFTSGGRVVFISAMHPRYVEASKYDTHDMLIIPSMLTVFTAPVLELGARIMVNGCAA
jgi:hypothetical protein